MPFKSEAQRRFFHWAKNEGLISPKVVEEFEEATPENANLPERLHPKSDELPSKKLKEQKQKDKKAEVKKLIKFTKKANLVFDIGFFNKLKELS